MIDWYSRLAPEEQKIVLATSLAAAASLWLAVAWEELMVLLALPALAFITFALLRATRRRVERRTEDRLY
jgi:membrane protein implicated in regulation of membrane protease activity